MIKGVFTAAQMINIRKHMTISRNILQHKDCSVTWFSLGTDTSISRESYDTPTIYLGNSGQAEFLAGDEIQKIRLGCGDMLIIPGGTLCGMECKTEAVYTEIITKKEFIMNNIVKTGESIKLKELISYEPNSIANLDVVKNDTMKFVLMAFDAGTGLQPHRAPGSAIVTALEGTAVINYEGVDYRISAGESFRFEKNGLHSVTADKQFKMSILLVLE